MTEFRSFDNITCQTVLKCGSAEVKNVTFRRVVKRITAVKFEKEQQRKAAVWESSQGQMIEMNMRI